jgi:hypothetical protein
MAILAEYYINIGGTLGDTGAVRYGFRAPTDAYDNIGAELGVVEVKDTDNGILFGANFPKPIKVRIRYRIGTGDSVRKRSVTRFCDPSKVEGVTFGRKLNGLKIKVRGTEYDIDQATIVNG